MRELIYFVAVTLDGYIAGPQGEYDAFLMEGDHMEPLMGRFADTLPTDFAQAQGVPQTRELVDTVLMGWNTYAIGGVPSPYRHLRQIVFSRSRTAHADSLEVTASDPREVVRGLKEEEGTGIWLCGGGALAAALAPDIDRLILKRHPVLFGRGIPLFEAHSYLPERFALVENTVFDSGVMFSEFVRVHEG